MQSTKDSTPLPHYGSVEWFPDVKRILFMAPLHISIDRMPFLVPSLDNTDPLLAPVISKGFYLHRVEVADKEPSSGSL